MELFADAYKIPSFDDIANGSESGTSFQQRIISPIMNGNMLGKFTVGSLAQGSTARIELDGTNQRIVINDGTYDRVIIGYQAGGF